MFFVKGGQFKSKTSLVFQRESPQLSRYRSQERCLWDVGKRRSDLFDPNLGERKVNTASYVLIQSYNIPLPEYGSCRKPSKAKPIAQPKTCWQPKVRRCFDHIRVTARKKNTVPPDDASEDVEGR